MAEITHSVFTKETEKLKDSPFYAKYCDYVEQEAEKLGPKENYADVRRILENIYRKDMLKFKTTD